MHVFIVFLLVLAVASPGEMKTVAELEKTVEELEKELQLLKIKFENVMESMDAKVEMIKGRTEKSISDNSAKITDIDQSIVTINTGIDKLENDVSRQDMTSSFCAYQDDWAADYSLITYDYLVTDYNDVAGSSLDTRTGLFTAGVGGTYRLDVGIGYMMSTESGSSYVYIQLNGVDMYEGLLVSRITGTSDSAQGAGRSLIVRLEKNDVVGISADELNVIAHITFCVDLVTVAT